MYDDKEIEIDVKKVFKGFVEDEKEMEKLVNMVITSIKGIRKILENQNTGEVSTLDRLPYELGEIYYKLYTKKHKK